MCLETEPDLFHTYSDLNFDILDELLTRQSHVIPAQLLDPDKPSGETGVCGDRHDSFRPKLV